MIKSVQLPGYTSEIIEFELKRKYNLPISDAHFLNNFFGCFDDVVFRLTDEVLYHFDEMDRLQCDLVLICYTPNYDDVEKIVNDLIIFGKHYSYAYTYKTDENGKITEFIFSCKYPYSALKKITIKFFGIEMKKFNEAVDKIIIDTEVWRNKDKSMSRLRNIILATLQGLSD